MNLTEEQLNVILGMYNAMETRLVVSQKEIDLVQAIGKHRGFELGEAYELPPHARNTTEHYLIIDEGYYEASTVHAIFTEFLTARQYVEDKAGRHSTLQIQVWHDTKHVGTHEQTRTGGYNWRYEEYK